MAEERGIRLEFAQFGHFDSFEVFRSLTPMDALSLPEPHATGLKTMRFMDNINLKNVLDRDLYYRVRVIRGTESMLSDELQAYISSFEAPKNLSVVFLDNALVSTWELDSPVSKHNYYCSETPIDPDNLPEPKAVLAGDVLTYTDTDITVSKTYYVRVGSVKNGIEKISSQIICHAEKLLVFLPLVVDATDLGSLGLNWTSVGGVTFNADGANFTTHAQYIYQNSYALNFNNDFKISLEVKRTNSTNTYPAILDNDINGTWAQRMFTLSLGGQNAATAFRDKFLVGLSGIYDQTTSLDIVNNQFYQVEFSRTANTIKLKVNNIEILSYINTDPINVVQFLKLGVALVNGANGQFKGCLRNFKIYDLT